MSRTIRGSVQGLDKRDKVSGPNAIDRYEAKLKEVRHKNVKVKTELSRAEERPILKNGRILREQFGVRDASVLQHQGGMRFSDIAVYWLFRVGSMRG